MAQPPAVAEPPAPDLAVLRQHNEVLPVGGRRQLRRLHEDVNRKIFPNGGVWYGYSESKRKINDWLMAFLSYCPFILHHGINSLAEKDVKDQFQPILRFCT